MKPKLKRLDAMSLALTTVNQIRLYILFLKRPINQRRLHVFKTVKHKFRNKDDMGYHLEVSVYERE